MAISINVQDGIVLRAEVNPTLGTFGVVEIGTAGGSVTVFVDTPEDARAFGQAFLTLANALELSQMRLALTGTA